MPLATRVPLLSQVPCGDEQGHSLVSMGVRVLARVPSISLPELMVRLDDLGGSRSSARWRVQCNYMLPRTADAGLRHLFVVQMSDAPRAHFIVSRTRAAKVEGAATGDGEEVRVLRAGPEIATVLEVMHTHRERLKLVVEGSTYRCGDFVVRVGQVFRNSALAGAAAEIEYLPCTNAAVCSAPLEAFADMLVPSDERDFCSMETECFQDVQDLPAAFGVEHSALLFVGLVRARMVGDDEQQRPLVAKPAAGRGELKRERPE